MRWPWCLLVVLHTSGLQAQSRAIGATRATTARVPAASQRILDEWVVLRYRGAQLLTDSVPSTPGDGVPSISRVEGIRGPGGDTLIAVHFASHPSPPSFKLSAKTTLAVPTGAITPTTGKVIARRQFRAPRTPRADNSVSADWRYGWVYLVVLSDGSNKPSVPPRGWLLLDSASHK